MPAKKYSELCLSLELWKEKLNLTSNYLKKMSKITSQRVKTVKRGNVTVRKTVTVTKTVKRK